MYFINLLTVKNWLSNHNQDIFSSEYNKEHHGLFSTGPVLVIPLWP